MSTNGSSRTGRRTLLAAVTIAGWLTSSASLAAVTPILGSVQASVGVSTNLMNQAPSDTDDWAGGPASLSAATSAFVFGAAGAFASAHAGVDAGWASATQGDVAFDFGWNLTSTPGDLAMASLGAAGPDWTYSFIPDVDSVFILDFLVSVSGTATDFSGWRLFDNGVVVSSAPTAPSSGMISHALTGGAVHILTLRSGASGAAFTQPLNGEMDGLFSWRIADAPVAAVPEPDTWALAIVGFGLCGATLRRRRRERIPATAHPS